MLSNKRFEKDIDEIMKDESFNVIRYNDENVVVEYGIPSIIYSVTIESSFPFSVPKFQILNDKEIEVKKYLHDLIREKYGEKSELEVSVLDDIAGSSKWKPGMRIRERLMKIDVIIRRNLNKIYTINI